MKTCKCKRRGVNGKMLKGKMWKIRQWKTGCKKDDKLCRKKKTPRKGDTEQKKASLSKLNMNITHKISV